MFNKLFNRAKAKPATSESPESPIATAAMAPAPIAVAPKVNRLEAFKEEWEHSWEASHEVIEGNGGNTDWAAWTEAVQDEGKSFAPTVPMPLGPE